MRLKLARQSRPSRQSHTTLKHNRASLMLLSSPLKIRATLARRKQPYRLPYNLRKPYQRANLQTSTPTFRANSTTNSSKSRTTILLPPSYTSSKSYRFDPLDSTLPSARSTRKPQRPSVLLCVVAGGLSLAFDAPFLHLVVLACEYNFACGSFRFL